MFGAMQEQLESSVLLPVGLVLSSFLIVSVWVITVRVNDFLRAKARSQYFDAVVSMLQNHVDLSVSEVEQGFVREKKASGSWDRVAATAARDMALAITVRRVSGEVEAICRDLRIRRVEFQPFLVSLIERCVLRQVSLGKSSTAPVPYKFENTDPEPTASTSHGYYPTIF